MDLIFRVYNFLKKNGFQLTFKKIINKIKEHYINSKKNKLINRQAKILYLIYDLKQLLQNILYKVFFFQTAPRSVQTYSISHGSVLRPILW